MHYLMEKFCEFIDSYHGRDKTLRLICFVSMYCSDSLFSKDISKKFKILSQNISSARLIMRLLDDIPALRHSISYNFGKQETDEVMRVCGTIVTLVNQIYYPLDHIAWAIDRKIITLEGRYWTSARTFCWAISLYFSAAKVANKDILRLEVKELLSAIRCLLDLVTAIHWLPKGILWAEKLRDWQVGALGTATSLISIYQSW